MLEKWRKGGYPADTPARGALAYRCFCMGCVAMIPSLLLEVNFGRAGKHLARIADGSGKTVLMQDATILVGLFASTLYADVVSCPARKAVQDAVAELGGALPAPSAGKSE